MQWWSYFLAGAALINSLLIIRKQSIGWVTGAGIECAWFAYAVTTSQWGFCVSSVFFLARDTYGWHTWRRESQVPRRPAPRHAGSTPSRPADPPPPSAGE